MPLRVVGRPLSDICHASEGRAIERFVADVIEKGGRRDRRFRMGARAVHTLRVHARRAVGADSVAAIIEVIPRETSIVQGSSGREIARTCACDDRPSDPLDPADLLEGDTDMEIR